MGGRHIRDAEAAMQTLMEAQGRSLPDDGADYRAIAYGDDPLLPALYRVHRAPPRTPGYDPALEHDGEATAHAAPGDDGL